MKKGVVFVQADAAGKIQPRERLLVRHYCALGRNKRPQSRRSRREATRAAERSTSRADSRLASSGLQSESQDSSLHPGSDPSQLFPSRGTMVGTTPVPSPPPSDWALFPFSEELDVRSQEMMHKC